MKMPQKTPARLRLAAAGLILLSSVPALRADYSSTVSSLSPLGYWRFDETAASPPLNTIANSGTLGSAANGFAVLDLGKGISGIVGNAVGFTNIGGVIGFCGSKIDVPFTAALNPATFSVEFWIKPTSLGGDTTGAALFSALNPNGFGGANRQGVVIYMTQAGNIQFRLGLNSGYAGALDATGGLMVPGTWKHVVCTYDGATQRIYVNGAAVGTLATSASASGWKPNSQAITRLGGTVLNGSLGTILNRPAILGANSYAGNRGYDGLMDEVAVYSTVLPLAKVKAHFDAATTNNAGYSTQILADAPLAYWPMNETAVTPPAQTSLPIAANSGSVGNAADGTNMWGTLTAQSGPPGDGFGVGNKAVYFDGANGSIGLPDAPGLHVSGNITLMAWVKPQARDFFRDIIANGLDDARGETFLRIGKLDDQLLGGTTTNYYEIGVCNGVTSGFNLLYPGGTANYYHSAVMQIPEGDFGNWVFLAGTYDGTQWNLYRNGVLAATYASTHGAWDVTNRWSIGSRADKNPVADPDDDPQEFAVQGLRFSGSMDEPAIFNTALSASDIATLYAAAQVKPVITRAVVAPSPAFAGSPYDFSVWAEGSPTLSYLWLTNGVSSGVTTTNFTTSLPAGAATVAVEVTNPYGSVTSSVAFTVSVPIPPAFVTQPVPASRYVGRPFTFSVTASGSTPIAYRWMSNGVPIPGATSSSYSGTASFANAFNYSCSISNVTTVVLTSAPVALTVLALPTGYGGSVVADAPVAFWRLGEASGGIAHDLYGGHDGTYFAAGLGQPGFSALDPDTAVAFNGTNSYAGAIDGNPATGGVNFSGHTNFTLEAWVNVPAGGLQEATIIAKGNGSSGTTASEQFALDVFPNPANGNPAFHFFTRAGGNIYNECFADIGPDGNWHHVVGVYDDLNALGGGTLRMYIFVDGDLRGTGAARAVGLRASTAPVTIGSKHLGNNPAYEATINGVVDEVAVYSYALTSLQISNHYALAYPGTKPTITKQPASLTVYESSPTPPSFTVGAFGEQPLTYQWKKNGVDLIDGGNIFGATTRTLTIGGDPNDPANLIPVTSADAGNYSVSINNSVGPLTNSTSATLTVIAAPTNAVNIPGLVLHLPFNDTLSDSSGRGNDGSGRQTTPTQTIVPAAPSGGNPDFNYVADGKLGKALHYRTYIDDIGNVTNAFFVTLGDKADLRFSTNVNFSVAYWVRFPAFNGVGDLGDLPFIATSPTSYGGTGYTFAPSYQLGSWSFSLNGNVQIYGGDYLIDDGNWHHLVHSFDRTGVAITYLDGKQVDVRAMSTAGNLDTGNPVTIGQGPTGLYPENGYYDIDDIGIWRRAISPLEAVGVYLAATLANSSFVDITPKIAAGPAANQVTVTWQAGTLQSSTSVNGVYVDVPAATSPYTVTAIGTTFYRTRY